MKKKIIIGCILTTFILMMTPSIPALNDQLESHRVHSSGHGETEYWGVIVGIADYDGRENDLPVSNAHMRLIYDTLVSKDNWDDDHVKLLLNDEAKQQDILDALDWLIVNADENDIVLFSYQGHGSSIDDDNGDETDGKDEGIVAWEGIEGIIIDDVLDEKFDNINAEGMMLIFHSCLSGGLIDESVQIESKPCNNYRIGFEQVNQRTTKSDLGVYSADIESELQAQKRYIERYTEEFTTDIEGDGRVILMSSMDQGLALAFPSLTRHVAYGFDGRADENNDDIITAEEASIYAKDSVEKMFLLFFLIFPPGIISFILSEIISKIRNGYWVIPIPQIYDGYIGDLPIIEL